MAKDKSDKERKKEKKEKKRSEVDGVHKSKKDKKDKKKDDNTLIDAVEKGLLTDKLAKGIEATASDKVNGVSEVVVETRPIGALVPFANPLVEDKTAKKVFKSVKKAAVNKSLKRGVKEVVKALRKSAIPAANVEVKDPVGIVILAADISPMDVISHIPVLCEEHGVPYVFVTSRAELGAAGATKRPTSVVMVSPKSSGKKKKEADTNGADAEDYSKAYADLLKIAKQEALKVKV